MATVLTGGAFAFVDACRGDFGLVGFAGFRLVGVAV